MISKWRQSWKNWSFERIENTLALSFKSQGVFTGFTNWEDDTTHLIISMLFLFFNWLDSYHNNVRSKEVIKTLPSQLQRVNMSHSSFFQQDLLAVFVFDVGPCNAMFYDVVRRQCDRLLCSVEKEKKNLVKYKICVLRSLSALGLSLVSWTSMLLNFVFWYSVATITCINNNYFSIALNIFHRQVQGRKHF